MAIIDMSECKNAQMQHEEDAAEWSVKWHRICAKLRAEGVIK